MSSKGISTKGNYSTAARSKYSHSQEKRRDNVMEELPHKFFTPDYDPIQELLLEINNEAKWGR